MSLPVISLRRDTVSLPDGQVVDVRGLTRSEAVSVRGEGDDVAAIEVSIIAFGTDTARGDVQAWYEIVPVALVDPIVAAITRLSGLEDDADPKDEHTPVTAPAPAPKRASRAAGS